MRGPVAHAPANPAAVSVALTAAPRPALSQYRRADSTPKQHATIEFEFGDVVADYAGLWVRLCADRYTYETGRFFYWWNIGDFADGLTRMHSELKGSCVLADWDGETILYLTTLDSVQGRIGIRGQLNQFVFMDEVASNGDFIFPEMFGNHAGIVVSFAGLVTDQSYLPPLISGLLRFLDESGIEHRPPWP